MTDFAPHDRFRSDGMTNYIDPTRGTISIAEAASRLDLTERTVTDWIRRGILTVLRFGPPGNCATMVTEKSIAAAKERADKIHWRRNRVQEAVRMHRAGVSYADIARELEYADISGAWRAVNRAMDREDA